jgi:hypothetical protein
MAMSGKIMKEPARRTGSAGEERPPLSQDDPKERLAPMSSRKELPHQGRSDSPEIAPLEKNGVRTARQISEDALVIGGHPKQVRFEPPVIRKPRLADEGFVTENGLDRSPIESRLKTKTSHVTLVARLIGSDGKVHDRETPRSNLPDYIDLFHDSSPTLP